MLRRNRGGCWGYHHHHCRWKMWGIILNRRMGRCRCRCYPTTLGLRCVNQDETDPAVVIGCRHLTPWTKNLPVATTRMTEARSPISSTKRLITTNHPKADTALFHPTNPQPKTQQRTQQPPRKYHKQSHRLLLPPSPKKTESASPTSIFTSRIGISWSGVSESSHRGEMMAREKSERRLLRGDRIAR